MIRASSCNSEYGQHSHIVRRAFKLESDNFRQTQKMSREAEPIITIKIDTD